MLEIWADEHFRVETEASLVRVTRSDAPFPSVEAMVETMEELNGQLDSIDRGRHRLLVDTRNAPPRNDAEFEQAFAPHRRRMLSGFARHAVLVRTEVGRLQVNRHARADGTELQAFRDEPTALAWLKS